jgi:sortase A
LNNYNVSTAQLKQTKHQMMKHKTSTPHLSGSSPLFAMFLFFSFVSSLAVASTEPLVASETPDSIELSMKDYVPDKTEWSEKASAKYEKTKDGGGVPMAVLTIERLNLKAPVYSGTRRITLDRGLGWVERTASPDEVGNIAISGHRDGFFRPLKDIKVGDTIEMQTITGTQQFEVFDISIVDALEVSVLDPTDTTVLTLITCHPFYFQGYAPDRYIVRAVPVGSIGNGGDTYSIQDVTNQVPTKVQ